MEILNKGIWKTKWMMGLALAGAVSMTSCNDDDDMMNPVGSTGNMSTFVLVEKGESGVSGEVMFTELEDGSTKITLDLDGTSGTVAHPAHIHENTAAAGGAIAVSLTAVDPTTGMSETIVSMKDDGSAISFAELTSYDGYVNVHLSSDDLGTLVAQGDIGQNVLTGTSKTFDLSAVAVADISGTATFYERMSGEALAVLELANTPAGGSHPAHIHLNTAAEGGAIAFTFNPIDGTTGMSQTQVDMLDDGTAFGYNDVLTFDGYVNVHLSADDLGTLVAQGDIGQNELTGTSKVYDLGAAAVADISGTATFYERANSEALAVIELMNTPAGGSHPAHIHVNTAAEGGGIAVTFNPINGDNGMSKTNISMLNDGTALTYAEILDFDGYINVHLSADDLGTLVAQGDIGQNELTGMSKVYDLGAVAVADISGTATFYERVNMETLAVIELMNTPAGGSHPAHIHMNTAAEGGTIAVTFAPINGDNGMSKTNISMLNDGTALTYTELLDFDGYINVHLSADDLGTLVAQGDIGQNELTGMSMTYNLNEKDVVGISGTAMFYERVNGETLAVLSLQNTPDGGSHPAHIHANDAATGGGIVYTFAAVDGTSGMSKSNIAALDDGTAITYSEILTYNGYINVHLSAEALGTIVAQGNIGSNVN